MKQIIKMVLFFFTCTAFALPVYRFTKFVSDGEGSALVSVTKPQHYLPRADFHCLQQCMGGEHATLHCREMCDFD